MFIYEIGAGMVEVMAIGTAIRRVDGLKTDSPQLPPQAIIRDRDTYFDDMHLPQLLHLSRAREDSSTSADAMQFAHNSANPWYAYREILFDNYDYLDIPILALDPVGISGETRRRSCC